MDVSGTSWSGALVVASSRPGGEGYVHRSGSALSTTFWHAFRDQSDDVVPTYPDIPFPELSWSTPRIGTPLVPGSLMGCDTQANRNGVRSPGKNRFRCSNQAPLAFRSTSFFHPADRQPRFSHADRL